MFLVDDVLMKPFVSLLNVLHDMAIDEMYDVESIRNDLKENQLLYELGERPTEEYERRKSELKEELELAERAREQLSGRVQVVKG